MSLVAPTVFLLTVVAWPLANLLGRADAAFGEVVTERSTWQVVWLALGQAGLSTALTLAVGLPLTFLITRYDFKGRALLNLLLTLPFVLPTVVVALAFTLVLPAPVNYGLFAVVLAHVYVNLAVVLRLVGGMLSQADRRFAQVAQMLGSGQIRANFSFTLRYATPAIVSAAAIVFVFCFTSLGIVLLLGGRQVPTLELEILRQATLLVNIDVAVALTVLQAVVVTFALGLSVWFQRRAIRPQVAPENTTRLRFTSGFSKGVVALVVALVAIVLATPIVGLVVASFDSDGGLTLAWWQGFWSIDAGTSRFINPVAALQSSILFAVGTGLIAALITISCAGVVLLYPRFTWLILLLIAPLGLSAVTVGLALLTSYGASGLGLATSVLIVVLSHSLIAVPLVLSAVLPSIRSLDSRLQMVAAGLGAKPWRSLFSSYGFALRRAGLIAGGLAAGVSFGEFGAASVVTRIDTATLPIMVVRLLSRPGEASLGLAAVAGVLLVGVVGVVVWWFDRLAKF